MPTCSPLGPAFNAYSVGITVPAGTPPGMYCVVGTASVMFPGGQVLTQSGDTVVCLVEAAPGQPDVPRLGLQLVSPGIVRVAPGDQAVAVYRVTNHDPSNSVQLTAFATSKQAAVRPQGANEAQGVFAISSPFGDDFRVQFNPGTACIPLPDHPYTQAAISSDLPLLGPGQSTTINVGIRSYGQCADGSCSESTLRVEGTFSDNSSALACAGMALIVDSTLPSQPCARQVNDCNGNGIPDALDIASRRSADQNFNAMPDECEEILSVPFFASVTPTNPLPGAPLAVQVAFNEAVHMEQAWANGSPLIRTQFFGAPLWMGTIPADTRPGPQTVYFLGKDSIGGLASYIAPYRVESTGLRITASVGGTVNGQPIDASAVGTGDAVAGKMTLDWTFRAIPARFIIWGSIVTKAGSVGAALARQRGEALNLLTLAGGNYRIHEVATVEGGGWVMADVEVSRTAEGLNHISQLSGQVDLPPLVGIYVQRATWTPVPGANQFIERATKYMLRQDGGPPIRVDAVATFTLPAGTALGQLQSRLAGMQVLSATPGPANPTAARIEYDNAVDISMHLDGLLSSPLGGAVLTRFSNQMMVANIGSSGQDGVSI